MKILHILNDGPNKQAEQFIGVQSKNTEVKVTDLTSGDLSYDALIDDIFSFDRVISW